MNTLPPPLMLSVSGEATRPPVRSARVRLGNGKKRWDRLETGMITQSRGQTGKKKPVARKKSAGGVFRDSQGRKTNRKGLTRSE